MGMHTPDASTANLIYHLYEGFLRRCQPAFLLIVRLLWGFLFAQTGWGKWQNISQVASFFTDLGIPLPLWNAYLVATTELCGGILLMLGLLSRLTPLPLVFAMIVAYLTTEQEALTALVSGDPDPFLSAAPFLFLLASLIVLLFGPGALSLDHWLTRHRETASVPSQIK